MGLSYTVSGDIASFRTPSRVPIESLKFHFLPKQASGTPSPENPIPIEGWTGLNGVRGGRNILNPFTNPIWAGWGIFYTINLDGSVTVSGSDWRAWGGNDISPFSLPKGTYTLSWHGADRIQITTSDESYSNATLYYYSTTGGHVSFTLSSDGGVKFKLFGDYPITCTVQIEPGSIAHDYVPYSEKAPIEQIPITFPVVGMNKLDPSVILNNHGHFSLNNGIWSNVVTDERTYIQLAVQLWKSTGTYIKTLYVDYVKTTGRHVLTFTVDDPNGHYICLKHNGTKKDFILLFPWTFGLHQYTISLDVLSADPTTVGGVQLTNIQLEPGDTAHSYEPYSSDNTFYGGYIDPVAGEIVATHAKCSFTFGTSGSDLENVTRRYFALPFNFMPANYLHFNGHGEQYKRVACNVAKWGWDYYGDYVHYYIDGSQTWVFLPIGTSSDTVVELCAELAEPIHIPIPAQDMKTFLDYNNFWSDANDITEVTYAVTESKDMLATRKKAIDFDHAHHKKVKWNNMAGAMNSQYWIRYNSNMIDAEFENNEALITVKDISSMPFPMSIRTNGDPLVYSNHRYYVSYCLYPYFDDAYFGAEFGNNVYTGYFYFEKNKWSRFSYRSKAGGDGMGRMYIPYFKPGSYAIGDSVRIKNAYYIDLTLMFGEGNEPTKAEFEHICEINGIDLTTYQPYDEGSDRWLIVP